MKHIGILGGTFNPPHMGHLVIAEQVRETLQLEEIWFTPSSKPPHKQEASISGEDRAIMLRKAIQGNPAFKMNTVELDRLGKSYSFDTMKLLVSNNPNCTFYFIIGADMVEYLPHWKSIEKLVNLVTFVGVKRTGYQLESDYSILEVEIPLLEISSSNLRERMVNNVSVKYLIPESVETYIKEKRLYEKR